MEGWIKLHRKTIDHWISSEPELLAFWVWMLIEANHAPRKKMFAGGLLSVDRGQLIFGRVAYAEKTGISERKIRRYLKLLQEDGMIDQQKTNKFTLISISNYDKYQITVQQVSSKRPASVQQASTLEECKEVKEEISAHPLDEYSEDFLSLWEIYPKKKSKGDAYKAWKKINPVNGEVVEIMEALKYWIHHPDWTKDGGQYCPYPATWLRARGWEDERKDHHIDNQYNLPGAL